MKQKLVFLRNLARFLYVQRITGFEPPSAPHLDEASLEWFQHRLSSTSSYLEFGSGGTTLVADHLGIPTVSVESDRFYASTVRGALKKQSNVRIIDVNIGLTRQWGEPIFRAATPARIKRWRRYSSAPFDTGTLHQFPDFVLVDGRFRRACALETTRQALSAQERVTLMFDDYYNEGRQHYHRVEDSLGPPERIGRAAVFEILPESRFKMPGEVEISEAASDFR